MVKKIKKIKMEEPDIASEEEILEVQSEINEELLNEKKLKEKNKKENGTYLFFRFFFNRLKEDKFYLCSFIVTITFFSIFSFNKLKETEGYYDKKNETKQTDNSLVPTINTDLNNSNVTNNKENDELNIGDYVGIYSKSVELPTPIKLTNTCNVTNYKVVYEIKKDKNIIKYFYNDCIGTIRIWSDTLKYVSNGGARYISANEINYLFSNSSMKEVDGDTYKLDEEIKSIKENIKVKDRVYIYDNNIVFTTDDDLILIKNGVISYQLTNKYKSEGGELQKLVYKSKNENEFRFIVFSTKENKSCYTTEELTKSDFKDEEFYKVFSIKYDSESGTFLEEKEIATRNKSDGCDKFNEDLKTLIE